MLRVGYRDNLFVDWLVELLFFPVWWYSLGLLKAMKYAWRFLERRERSLGFAVWFRNLFVPMYGQYDLMGRLISFLVRSVQVAVRGAALLFYAAVALGFVLLWLGLPLLTLLSIINNLNA